MKIRSITLFFSPKRAVTASTLKPLGQFAALAKEAFEQADYEVQTLRLATTPFPRWVRPLTQSRAVETAVELEAAALESGFGYVSLGPALPGLLESYAFVVDMLAATKAAFFSGVIAEKRNGIRLDAIRACAGIMQRAASLEPGGFANLRFAALANVPAGAPFLPAAYHVGGSPAFAIAPQTADLAVDAFTDAPNIAYGSHALTQTIQTHANKLARIARRLAKQSRIRFGGIDFSMAPFPSERDSLGTAFERMGVPAVGLQGSLTAAAILTAAMDAAKFPRVGFNGLLMPPLEDALLARRAAEGTLNVGDLLLYSTVCGTGLDTVPVPGNTTVEQISALLLDLAALALRLDKPLTARLMPIPGKLAGDKTSFDFPFFANSRVMALNAQPLHAPLAEADEIAMSARRTRKDN